MKTITHKIIQWDCLEVMKKIPNASIDFICSDFPYNISNNWWLTIRGNKIVKADFWEWDKMGFSSRVYRFCIWSMYWVQKNFKTKC